MILQPRLLAGLFVLPHSASLLCIFLALFSLLCPMGTSTTLQAVLGPDLLWDVGPLSVPFLVCVSSTLCMLYDKAQVTVVTVSLIVIVITTQ